MKIKSIFQLYSKWTWCASCLFYWLFWVISQICSCIIIITWQFIAAAVKGTYWNLEQVALERRLLSCIRMQILSDELMSAGANARFPSWSRMHRRTTSLCTADRSILIVVVYHKRHIPHWCPPHDVSHWLWKNITFLPLYVHVAMKTRV